MHGYEVMFFLGAILIISGFGYRYRRGIVYKKDRLMYSASFSTIYMIFTLVAFQKDMQFAGTAAFILAVANVILFYSVGGLKGNKITIYTTRWLQLSTDMANYFKDQGIKVKVTPSEHNNRMQIKTLKVKETGEEISISVMVPRKGVPSHCTIAHKIKDKDSLAVQALKGFINKVKNEYPYDAVKNERFFYLMGAAMIIMGITLYFKING